ncbi:LPXTG cell wall anchor domain-containing protein [Vagococcus sp. JNUCC 83]
MSNQVDITGIIGQEETVQIHQTPSSNTIEVSSVSNTYYGELPKTSEYMNIYILGLGLTIISILIMIFYMRKSSQSHNK